MVLKLLMSVSCQREGRRSGKAGRPGPGGGQGAAAIF
jgi:hypothetical protein